MARNAFNTGEVWKPVVGGAVALWLVRSTSERAVRVQVLAGDIVLCSWARHFTLTEPLSTQVYKWVPVNLMLGGNPAMDNHPIQGGVEILLVTSCYRNQDKLQPDGTIGLYADFTFTPRRAIGTFKGEGVSKAKIFQGKYEPKLYHQEGWGEGRIQTKIQSMGRVWTFSGKTYFPFYKNTF